VRLLGFVGVVLIVSLTHTSSDKMCVLVLPSLTPSFDTFQVQALGDLTTYVSSILYTI
jgi:hypothetical protein